MCCDLRSSPVGSCREQSKVFQSASSWCCVPVSRVSPHWGIVQWQVATSPITHPPAAIRPREGEMYIYDCHSLWLPCSASTSPALSFLVALVCEWSSGVCHDVVPWSLPVHQSASVWTIFILSLIHVFLVGQICSVVALSCCCVSSMHSAHVSSLSPLFCSTGIQPSVLIQPLVIMHIWKFRALIWRYWNAMHSGQK